MIKLDLQINEVNSILATLGKQPYESVFTLVENIRKQAESQVAESNKTEEKEENQS
jgi:hypothetical protein